MKTVFIFISIFLFSKTGFSQEWLLIQKFKDSSSWFIKSKYESKGEVDSRKNIIKIWIKSSLPSYNFHGKIYKNLQQVALEEFDCEKKQYKVDIIKFYTAANKLLETLNVKDFGGSKWLDIASPAIDEMVLNEVCARFN